MKTLTIKSIQELSIILTGAILICVIIMALVLSQGYLVPSTTQLKGTLPLQNTMKGQNLQPANISPQQTSTKQLQGGIILSGGTR